MKPLDTIANYRVEHDLGEVKEPMPSRRIGWFAWPAAVGLIALPLLMVLKAPEHTEAVLIAYVNCILGTCAIIYFARKPAVEALVPVLFLPMVVISWPLASLYFAMFDPDIIYRLKIYWVKRLDGNIRLQVSTFIFLLGYLPIMFFALRKSTSSSIGYIKYPQRTADFVAVFGTSVIFANGVSKLIDLPSTLVYIIDGLWLYLSGILFVSGALFTFMSKKVKIYLAIMLPAIVLFYTLGNARGMAIIPCALFAFGILFFSELKPKIKLIILLVGLCCVPVYIVVGNTTRVFLKDIGFHNLDKRLDAIQHWDKVVQHDSFLKHTFARLFHSGGHRIVTTTPEKYPYLQFDLFAYIKEFFLSLVPQRFYHETFYRGNDILLRYGFNISDQTSVEVSMLGNFWLLGGYLSVFLGSIAVGLLQTFLVIILRRAKKTSGAKQLFIFGVMGATLIGITGYDFIHQWRRLFWCVIIGLFFYKILSLCTGEWAYRFKGDKTIA